jgi:hypothetical protein
MTYDGPSAGGYYTTLFSALLVGKGIARLWAWLGAAPFFIGEGGNRYAHGLLARRRLCLLLYQLQKPLSASPRQLPRGQPPSWDTSAGLDQGFCVRVLGEWLGDHTHLCSDAVDSVLTLHLLPLSHNRYLAQLVVQVALHLTVVTSTNAQSGAAMHAMDVRAAWEEPNAGVAHDTTAIPGPTSNDP